MASSVALPFPPLTLLAVASVTYILVRFLHISIRSPLSHVPGPWHTRFTDVPLRWVTRTGQKMYYIHDLHEQYGPVVRISPTEVSTMYVENAKRIHAIPTKFAKDSWYSDLSPRRGIGNVFSERDVKEHSRMRRKLGMPLAESELKHMEPILTTIIRDVVRKMSEEMKTTGATDVFKWSSLATADLIIQMTFGANPGLVESGQITKFVSDVKDALKMGSIRSTAPELFRLIQFIARLSPWMFGDHERVVKQQAETYIASYFKQRKAGTAPPTVFDKLWAGGEDGLTPEVIVSNSITYIVAGTDTTATTFSYMVWVLARRPDLQAAVRAEFAKYNWNDDLAMRESSLLQNFYEESLRLYSAAQGRLPRVVPAEGVKLGEFFVPGGSTVSTQAYSLHRNKDVFEDPMAFKPERWEHPTQQMRDAMMPFGGGARTCIGINLARKELRAMLCEWCRVMGDWSTSTSEEGMMMLDYLVMIPKEHECVIRPVEN